MADIAVLVTDAEQSRFLQVGRLIDYGINEDGQTLKTLFCDGSVLELDDENPQVKQFLIRSDSQNAYLREPGRSDTVRIDREALRLEYFHAGGVYQELADEYKYLFGEDLPKIYDN